MKYKLAFLSAFLLLMQPSYSRIPDQAELYLVYDGKAYKTEVVDGVIYTTNEFSPIVFLECSKNKDGEISDGC